MGMTTVQRESPQTQATRTTALSLNRGHPAPLLEWALSEEAERRMWNEPGPRCELRACWMCPVCSAAVHRLPRSGRQGVYCTNACRQRAYRLRRTAGRDRPLSAIRRPLPERATSRDRIHAIREFRDASTGRRDSVGRGITACGTFARMSIDTPWRFGHTEFRATLPESGSRTCRRCMQLTGVEPRPLTPGGL
jgi:hypothetical protein